MADELIQPFRVTDPQTPLPLPGDTRNLYGPILNMDTIRTELASTPLYSESLPDPIVNKTIQIKDGLETAGGLDFYNDPGNGIYRITDNNWALTTNGAKRIELSDTIVTITAALNVSGYLNVGTVTDASGTGDLASGLTGASRMFFDQSDQSLSVYDSSNNQDLKLDMNGDSWYNGTGNFGIGVATGLAAKLHVANSIFGDPQLRLDALFGYYVDILCDGNADLVITNTPGLGQQVILEGGEDNTDYRIVVHNTNTTNGNSGAVFYLQTGGTSGGDPYMVFDIPGRSAWIIGNDNSDSGKLKVATGAAGGFSSPFLTIGTDGEATFSKWLQVGTATDSATAGDLVAGLTGASRFFFDQSDQAVSIYDSSNRQDFKIDLNGPSWHRMRSTSCTFGFGTDDPDAQVEIVENSGSSQFRLTYAQGLFYTDIRTVSTGLLAIQPTGCGVTLDQSNEGGDVLLYIANNDDVDPTSHARIRLSTPFVGGGDPVIEFSTDWFGDFPIYAVGLDATDNFFKIAYNDNVGTNDRIIIDTSGLVGICKSVPVARLHVTESTVGNEIFRIESTATNDDPMDQYFHGRLATTGNTQTTINTITIPASTTVMLEAFVRARRTGGSAGTAEDAAGYVIRGTYKNVAGTATLVGAVDANYTAEDQAAWDATFTVTGATALLRVTGETNNNITWHSTVIMRKVST